MIFSLKEVFVLERWKFGINNNKLIELVLSNKKRATTSLYIDDTRLPKTNEESIICYDNNNPACIVKTIDYKIMKFCEMTDDLALLEGEGNLSNWKKIHYDFFKSIDPSFNEESKIIFEIFQVVCKGDDSNE